MKMGERGILEDPWKCLMNDCIFSFPENSSRLINFRGRTKKRLSVLTLSIPSSLWWATILFLFWIKKEQKRKSGIALCFIRLFYYFHFLVFIHSLSRRMAIHHHGGEQQQNPNSEGGGWFIASLFLCSTFLLLSMFVFLGESGIKVEGREEWGEVRGKIARCLWAPNLWH